MTDPEVVLQTGMSDGDDVRASASASASVSAPGRPTLKQRLAKLVDRYGRIALITYFALSILTIAGFSVAFGVGAAPSTATGVIGVIGAGWVAAKATLPLRILVTLGVTPVLAFLVARRGRTADAAVAGPAGDAELR